MTMPRMGGLQLLQAMQRQDLVGLSAIIALSSDVVALQQAIAMGICHALSKPFDLEALLALVERSSL